MGSGFDPAALTRALALVEAHGASAQLCVLQDGRVALDRSVRCRPDDLFWIFSASKPFVALLVHRLAEQGALSLDDPVAAHWPEFALSGKQAITIRHVLQHRSGLPVARSMVKDALAMTSWERSVHYIERARARYPAGQVPAYHYLTYGFILGEIVQRVTGTPIREVLAAEFLRPLGLTALYLGLPRHLSRRAVPLRGDGAVGRLTRAVVNRHRTRQAVIPAAGISATARDLARFYQALLQGGELDGARILKPAAISEATRPSSDGALDQFLGRRIRWSQGFQLGGPAPGRSTSHPMGQTSSPDTFGHNGSYTCLAWADPGRRVVMAYLTNYLPTGATRGRHVSQVSDAILAAWP